MKNIILKTKHWQLFIIIFAIPLIIQLVTLRSIMSDVFQMGDLVMPTMDKYLRVLPIIGMLYVGGIFSWLWSVGVGLQSKIPDELKMNVNSFKIALLTLAILVFGGIGSTYMMLESILEKGDMTFNSFENISNMISYIAPFQLICIGCVLYCFFFVAKTIKTAELKKAIDSRDYILEIILIWFFFVGVWILQPIINELVEEGDIESDYL